MASELAEEMRSHRAEVVDAMVARTRDTLLSRDITLTPAALAELRPTAAECVDAVIDSIVEGDRWTATLPPGLIRWLKEMARLGVSLEEILRGFTMVGGVLIEFLVERLDERRAQDLLRNMAIWQGRNSDRLMNAFAAEYLKEAERLEAAPIRRLAERVKNVLDGGSVTNAGLDYRLDASHIGLIAVGARAELACRSLAEKLGCALLLLPEDESTAWAWLGARRQIEFAELERAIATEAGGLVVAAGEPRDGVVGWRLTHREAQTALPVALLDGQRLTRCSDVALLAYGLCDEAIGGSLVDRYLRPLERHRDNANLRETLRTYLRLNCNAASAASSLGVNRHTVQRRLTRVEQAIGESLPGRRAELEVALRLTDLTGNREPRRAITSR